MPTVPPVPDAAGDRIRANRIYRAARVTDGNRVLVDRQWPRGLSKDRDHLRQHLEETGDPDARP
jgi:uncharacterized protein YeaO (DUF488 family)